MRVTDSPDACGPPFRYEDFAGQGRGLLADLSTIFGGSIVRDAMNACKCASVKRRSLAVTWTNASFLSRHNRWTVRGVIPSRSAMSSTLSSSNPFSVHSNDMLPQPPCGSKLSSFKSAMPAPGRSAKQIRSGSALFNFACHVAGIASIVRPPNGYFQGNCPHARAGSKHGREGPSSFGLSTAGQLVVCDIRENVRILIGCPRQIKQKRIFALRHFLNKDVPA